MSDTWSYSRLSSYWDCPYQFYLKYIEQRQGIGNSWADVGTFSHKIMEDVANGVMPPQAVSDIFVEEYPETDFPDLSSKYDYGEKLRDELLDYFDNFDGLKGETVGVEQKFEIELSNGDTLVGFMDRVYRDGGLVVSDYKISAPFKKTDLPAKQKQLYIYAEACREIYGEYPKYMEWEFLKAQKTQRVKFNKKELDKTFDWIMETIELINSDIKFEAKPNFFVCQHLCDFRDTCEKKK